MLYQNMTRNWCGQFIEKQSVELLHHQLMKFRLLLFPKLQFKRQKEQYQSITKDFLQDHIDKLIIDEKIMNRINRDKSSHKVNREQIDIKDQSFPVSLNEFPPASVVIPIIEKNNLD